MRTHIQRELDVLQHQVMLLASRVGESLRTALDGALECLDSETVTTERKQETFAALKKRDREIDRLEVELEEECLKVLALYQPVAVDLRNVISLLKLNNDLERIGDHSVSIAQCARWVSPGPWSRLREMLDRTFAMYQGTLHLLGNADTKGIRAILQNDDQIDELKHHIRREIRERIGTSADQIGSELAGFEMAYHLERVADLCTNICEDLHYAQTAEIIRHENSAEPQ